MPRRTYSTLAAIAPRPGHALSLIEDMTEAGDSVYLEDLNLEITNAEEPIQASALTYAAVLLIRARESQREEASNA